MAADKDYSLGGMIASLRISEGLSQKELADKLRVEEADVRNMEKGNVNLKSATKVAGFFHVSLDFLLTGELPVKTDTVHMTADIAARLDDTSVMDSLLDAAEQGKAVAALCEASCKRGGMKVLAKLLSGAPAAEEYFREPANANALAMHLLSCGRIREMASSAPGWLWPSGIKSLLAEEDGARAEGKAKWRCALTDEAFEAIASEKLTSRETFRYLLEQYDGQGTGTADTYWVYGLPHIMDKCYELKSFSRLEQALDAAEKCNAKACSAAQGGGQAGAGAEPGLNAVRIAGRPYGYAPVPQRTVDAAVGNEDYDLFMRFMDINRPLAEAGLDAYVREADEITSLKAYVQGLEGLRDPDRESLMDAVNKLDRRLYRDVAIDLCILLEDRLRSRYRSKLEEKPKLVDLLSWAYVTKDIGEETNKALSGLRVYRNRAVHAPDPEDTRTYSFLDEIEKSPAQKQRFFISCIKQACIAVAQPQRHTT